MDKALFHPTGVIVAGPTLQLSLFDWHGSDDDGCGDEITTVDVSHWSADQFRRFWEFVHAN